MILLLLLNFYIFHYITTRGEYTQRRSVQAMDGHSHALLFIWRIFPFPLKLVSLSGESSQKEEDAIFLLREEKWLRLGDRIVYKGRKGMKRKVFGDLIQTWWHVFR